MGLVSKEEIVTWLEDKLAVKNVEARFDEGSESRHKLLNQIIRAYQRDIPFQTITIGSQEVSKRHVPRAPEICANIMALKGGVCIDLNFFMKVLLETLGYKVCLLGGNYTADGAPFTHVMVLVNSLLQDGDKFLVDVGCGFPTFHAVPLEKLPYAYLEGGMEVMYIQEGNTIFRMQRKGDFITDDTPPIMKDGWRIVFDFDLVPRELEFFDAAMEAFFVDGPFLQDMHLCRFPEQDKMVAFKDKMMYQYDDEHRELGLQKKLVPEDHLQKTILKHFPNLCKDDVAKALEHYLKVWDSK